MRRDSLNRTTMGLAAAFLLAATAAESRAEPQPQPLSSQDRASPFMRVFGPANPPYGFVRFCLDLPAECERGPLNAARLQATPERMSELDAVNRHVNRIIEPATDREIYGVEERWALPDARGDCEDYALLKRHILIARGWPPGALVMTVVRDERGDGHAVLTVRLSSGDYILDNKSDEIRLWSRTPYAYMMRQSYVDPMVWVSLDATFGRTPEAIAGNRSRR